MKPSARFSIPAMLIVAAALLSGCGQQASSVTAPGVGPVAGAKINASEGPFGGQTVAWYAAQLNSHAVVGEAAKRRTPLAWYSYLPWRPLSFVGVAVALFALVHLLSLLRGAGAAV